VMYRRCMLALMRMIRKQVYIDGRHEAALKRAARARGVSEAEIIRHGIELAATEDVIAIPKRSAIAEQAWREIQAVLEARKRVKAPQTPRGWTRDELYEERLARLTH
jgi:hypothetical protein